jgi:hypothetical protein
MSTYAAKIADLHQRVTDLDAKLAELDMRRKEILLTLHLASNPQSSYCRDREIDKLRKQRETLSSAVEAGALGHVLFQRNTGRGKRMSARNITAAARSWSYGWPRDAHLLLIMREGVVVYNTTPQTMRGITMTAAAQHFGAKPAASGLRPPLFSGLALDT